MIFSIQNFEQNENAIGVPVVHFFVAVAIPRIRLITMFQVFVLIDQLKQNE